uniref:Uncharacterized protein n=1 Tax=Tetranychus urticae TaxID=32264 RepID=T1KY69_TETUR
MAVNSWLTVNPRTCLKRFPSKAGARHTF